MASKLCFVSFLFLVSLQVDTLSAVNIKIVPELFNKEDASNVVITCRVDDKEKDAKELTLLKISRKGERAIVVLYPNNTVSYLAGNEEEFPAKGNIYSDVADSSLEMTITSPDKEDAGAYICHAQYTTAASGSDIKDNKATGKLTVEEPEMKSLNNTIKQLLDKVEKEKEGLEKIKQKEAEDKAKVLNLEGKADQQSKDIKSLLDKEAKVENKVKELEKKTQDKIKEITDGIDKNPKVKALKDNVKKLLAKVETEEKDIKDLNKKKEEEGRKIKTLELTVEGQEKSIKDLTQKISEFERMIENFKGETRDNLDRLSADKNKGNSNTGNDLEDLKNAVDAHKEKVDGLADKVNKIVDVESKVDELAWKLDNQKSDNEAKSKNVIDSHPPTSLIAFHATSGLGNMYPIRNQPLLFSEVSLNIGGAYNGKTGIFTVAKAGIYAFHLFLQVPCYGCRIGATIEANNKVLSRFSGGNRYDHDQHSVTAVASLSPGDIVKAIATKIDNPNNRQFSLGFMSKSGFSGYLIASSS